MKRGILRHFDESRRVSRRRRQADSIVSPVWISPRSPRRRWSTPPENHRLGDLLAATDRSCWCSSDISVDCTAANMLRSCVSATTRSTVWAPASSRSGRVIAATPRAFVRARSRSCSSCLLVDDDATARAASLRTLNWFQLLHARTWKATRETSKRGHHIPQGGQAGERRSARAPLLVIGFGSSAGSSYEHLDADTAPTTPRSTNTSWLRCARPETTSSTPPTRCGCSSPRSWCSSCRPAS